ncbi:MAG: M6 family metalloprotease domain-containing protein [Muribaculaceae bacterium]|nr:M6 family metalloprotease domain-containing protein [Muribaculaceae bacterium]
MMNRLLLTIVALATCWTMMLAAPAKPDPFVHTQSDGTTVTLVMQGGERIHSLTTLDGLTVQPTASGDYCYVVGGALSDVLAHDEGQRSIEEMAFITAYGGQMTLGAGVSRMPRREEEPPTPQVPTIGSPRIPIILVNYDDVKFISTDPIATFENQFNEKQYSCLHYFEDQSRGMFSPQFDILGPVELPQNREFYGDNIRKHGTEVDQQLGTMIYDACTGLPDVDFSNYDNDNDGYVDVVVVLYAGVGEAQAWRAVPESVWPCQWDMREAYQWGCSTTGPFQLNGVTIDKFAVFNELEGGTNSSTSIDGVGTFCHEFGHCLGLPDFYNTEGGSSYGMSSWDIMDHGCYLNNGHRPAGYTSYERHFMGWMNLIDPKVNTRYSLSPLGSGGAAVKVVNDANPDEYYLLEYRVKSGWDEYLSAEGIMILHVDYDKNAWDNNCPNNNANHQRMTLIPADNVLSSINNRTDLWPQGSLDSLTNNSVPAAEVFTGGYMNKPITGMTVNSELQIAGFWYMQGVAALRGDADGDGEVTIADITVIIDYLIMNDPYIISLDGADADRDDEITISDIVAIIDYICFGEWRI